MKNEARTTNSIGKSCVVIDCEHKTAPYVAHSEYLVVRTSNIRNGQLIFDDIKYTTRKAFIEWTQRTTPRYPDILFTREAPAGEACIVPKLLNICMGQRTVLIRPNSGSQIDARFLAHYFLTDQGKREIYRYSIGSTVTRINIEDILKIEFYCPPLEEQQKIASFLNAVDEKIGNLQRRLELLQTYKRGVMQKLFSQEIRFTREDGSRFPDWEAIEFGQVFEFIRTNSLSRVQLSYGTGTVQNIHYGDIHTKFASRFEQDKETIPFIKEPKTAALVKDDEYCKVGDLVIADASEDYKDIGKTIEIVSVKEESLVAGLHTYIARPKPGNVATGFPGYLMQSHGLRNQITRSAQGVSVLGISKTQLAKMVIPKPHLEEQQKIATFLSAIDHKLEAVKRQISLTERFKKGLLQQMFV